MITWMACEQLVGKDRRMAQEFSSYFRQKKLDLEEIISQLQQPFYDTNCWRLKNMSN